MKPCFEFSQWRRKSLERTLTPDEAAAFTRHCSQCAACNQAFDQARRLDELLHLAGERRAPAEFNQKVWNRIHQAQAAEPVQRRAWLPLGLAAGTLVALIVLGFARYAATPRVPAVAPGRTVAGAVIPGVSPVQAAAPKITHLASPGVETATAAGPASEERFAETKPKIIGALPAPVNSGAVAAPVSDFGRRAEKVKADYQPAALAAPVKPNGHTGSEKQVASEIPKAMGFGGPTPGLLPGRVQVRPNTIRPGRGERLLLEVNPEATGHLEARIYTREGRLVRTLVDADVASGYRSWEWDGTNNNQERISAGVYFLYVRGNVPEQKFKLAVIR